jgi:hypothetical protein
MDYRPATLPGLQLRHAHCEPSSARIDVSNNEHPRVPIDAGLDATHGRDPGDFPQNRSSMNRKYGAEVMALNEGRLTGLGVGVSRNTPHVGAHGRPEMPHILRERKPISR